jgi:hypothetical protein
MDIGLSRYLEQRAQWDPPFEPYVRPRGRTRSRRARQREARLSGPQLATMTDVSRREAVNAVTALWRPAGGCEIVVLGTILRIVNPALPLARCKVVVNGPDPPTGLNLGSAGNVIAVVEWSAANGAAVAEALFWMELANGRSLGGQPNNNASRLAVIQS